jgi:hypothetical protein
MELGMHIKIGTSFIKSIFWPISPDERMLIFASLSTLFYSMQFHWLSHQPPTKHLEAKTWKNEPQYFPLVGLLLRFWESVFPYHSALFLNSMLYIFLL